MESGQGRERGPVFRFARISREPLSRVVCPRSDRTARTPPQKHTHTFSVRCLCITATGGLRPTTRRRFRNPIRGSPLLSRSPDRIRLNHVPTWRRKRSIQLLPRLVWVNLRSTGRVSLCVASPALLLFWESRAENSANLLCPVLSLLPNDAGEPHPTRRAYKHLPLIRERSQVRLLPPRLTRGSSVAERSSVTNSSHNSCGSPRRSFRNNFGDSPYPTAEAYKLC